VDHTGNYGQVINRLVVGFSCNYFTVVMFNEAWIVSTLVYSPLVSYWFYKTNQLLEDSEMDMFIMVFRAVFMTTVYCSVAYRVEILQK